MEAFLHSTEFYVVMLMLAAMAVAAVARPSGRGEAVTEFAAGTLSMDADDRARVEAICQDDGSVILRRCGLLGLTDSATVALAVTRIGFDITIEERITPGGDGVSVNCATFRLEGLAHERYHLKYKSDGYSRFVAFTLHNRPGMTLERDFA